MVHVPCFGSGPYCCAHSFAMRFGADAPSTAVIEFATGSPFGMQLIGGQRPFFDPYGCAPVELEHLRHQPSKTGTIGADCRARAYIGAC